jgi:hypothetical protein
MMKKEGGADKFVQISDIFSQFSEENKDKLLEMAKKLLKVQEDDTVSVLQNKAVKGRCP